MAEIENVMRMKNCQVANCCQLCVLATLELFPIDIVVPIVLTGTLPVLILLQAVKWQPNLFRVL